MLSAALSVHMAVAAAVEEPPVTLPSMLRVTPFPLAFCAKMPMPLTAVDETIALAPTVTSTVA
ncbi:hypothetical protein D3C87_1114070 [compost metagenome]